MLANDDFDLFEGGDGSSDPDGGDFIDHGLWDSTGDVYAEVGAEEAIEVFGL